MPLQIFRTLPRLSQSCALAAACVMLSALARYWPLQGLADQHAYFTFYPALTLAAHRLEAMDAG